MNGRLRWRRGGPELAQFLPGDRVRVLPTPLPTHHRTPDYVKGKVGTVHALSGSFYDPETRAYGASGLPKRPLYLVRFDMEHLWGKRGGRPCGDSLLVDLFEHWLQPVKEPDRRRGER